MPSNRPATTTAEEKTSCQNHVVATEFPHRNLRVRRVRDLRDYVLKWNSDSDRSIEDGRADLEFASSPKANRTVVGVESMLAVYR